MSSVYSIRDVKTDMFGPVFSSRTDGEATRNLRDIVASPEQMMHRYAEDYTLYRLGTVDDESGALSPLIPPLLVCTVLSLLPPPAVPPGSR